MNKLHGRIEQLRVRNTPRPVVPMERVDMYTLVFRVRDGDGVVLYKSQPIQTESRWLHSEMEVLGE